MDLSEFLNNFVSHHKNPPKKFLDQAAAEFKSVIAATLQALGPKAFRLGGSLNAAVFDSVTVGIARRLDNGNARNSNSDILAMSNLISIVHNRINCIFAPIFIEINF